MDPDAAHFVRDEEQEDLLQQLIYQNARGPEPDGDGKDDGDELTSQFLNDSGEGLESGEIRDDEVPLTNSGNAVRDLRLCSSVDALIYLYCTY